ncbi:MAG: hypothetical protein R2911_45420 [Caldilineaceae bacterium]
MTTCYSIRIREHLDTRWSERFAGLTIVNQPDGSTELVGEICDQAALHGVLAQVRDLGLELLALRRIDAIDDE